jgi:hypothetical protein
MKIDLIIILDVSSFINFKQIYEIQIVNSIMIIKELRNSIKNEGHFIQ